MYAASLDISSAFDTVPHEPSLDAFQSTKVDKFHVKFAGHWLGGRTFRVRIMTEDGQLFG